jgi:hypothetical protein
LKQASTLVYLNKRCGSWIANDSALSCFDKTTDASITYRLKVGW